jgi:hypothetical protein
MSTRVAKTFTVPVYCLENTVQAIRIDSVALRDTPFGEVFRRYERYFINSCEFTWNPSVSKTARGMIHAYPETDVIDLMASYSMAPTEHAQMWGYKAFPILQTAKVGFPNITLPSGEKMRGNLFTSPIVQERLSVYGELRFAIQGIDMTEFPHGTFLGNFIVALDATFSMPQYPHSYQALGMSAGTRLACYNYAVDSMTDDTWPNHNGIDTFPHITLKNDGNAGVSMTDSGLYSARIAYNSEANSPYLKSEDGQIVPPGTMVYWAKADKQVNEGDLLVKNNNNTRVGKIFLSRALNGAARLAWHCLSGHLDKYVKLIDTVILRD